MSTLGCPERKVLGMRRNLYRLSVLVFAAGLVPMGAPIARAGGSLTYTVRLDAQPPGDEPWAFNRMFPPSGSTRAT